MENISPEEKLDYIYTRLKKQEKTEKLNFFLKWGFRVFIVGYLYYFLTVGLPLMIDKIVPDIPSFGGDESSSDVDISAIRNIVNEYLPK